VVLSQRAPRGPNRRIDDVVLSQRAPRGPKGRVAITRVAIHIHTACVRKLATQAAALLHTLIAK